MCVRYLQAFACAMVVCVSARPDIGLKLREGSPTGSYLPGVQQNYASPVGYSGSSNYGSYQGVGGPQGYGGQVSYNTYGGGAAPQYSGYNVQQNFAGIPQAVQHHRSFFFDAPEDLGETHVRVHVQPSAADGDKTIYIRAPAYNSKVVPHFNIGQQQAAGKTKVYVLVKKPEEQQDIVVPAAAAAPAAKPEVVFVKYSNQKEAEQKIQDIQEGASGGDSAKTVFNHRELVSSIKDQPAHHDISYNGAGIGGGFIGGSGIGGGIVGGSSGVHTVGSVGPSTSAVVSGGETHYGPAGESGPY
ncbi:PREDICTED: uncharacterized protein LOC108562072 [Nicrophorus vespilloides]|uniref:Uncharacterized protein LOC108562072 n=1 Tax=Nicrophorus vespilloides TaxID=110193 RepID=A0ABM1MMG6_NICVS|nr:PREDICTED: uncharacterized protein LOC108562072 [Nicrophorus vespilloides]